MGTSWSFIKFSTFCNKYNLNCNNNQKMEKYGTSIKPKFKSSRCQKFKNKTKRQKRKQKQQLTKQQQQQQQQLQTTYPPMLKIPTPPKIFNFSISWHHCWPSQSVETFKALRHYKFSLLLYELFKLRICTLSSVILSLISLAKASKTTLAPITHIFEDELVVCVPQNHTDSCIKYINSSINGLIELNESLYPALKGFRGSYDYKMIARINPFWLTFEPPSDVSYYVMGTMYVLIFVFGVTGNGLVIYMFARCKALRTTSNILVFNLAISDFMIVIKCPVAAYNNFMRGPALGDWGCRLYGFMGGFSGCASIGMLTVISLDRYSVVVNPLSPLRFSNTTKYYYYCLLLVAWFEAFFFSVIPLLEVGLSVYVPEGYLTTCSFDYLDKTMPARIFMFVFFVFAWCLPLLSICYCYFHIVKAVCISKIIQSNHNKHKIEVRLAFIVLLVIGLWFLAWTPYSIVAMMGVFGMEKHLTPTRSMIPALFCKTAACLNPFLYTISHKRFRHELQRLFGKRKPIYQYSMTRSSYVNRSSRRFHHHVDNCAYGERSGKNRNNLKLKLTTISSEDYCNETIAGGLNTVTNTSSNVFHHRPNHKKSSPFRKQSSPVVSSEEAGIFVLNLDDSGSLKEHRLETSF